MPMVLLEAYLVPMNTGDTLWGRNRGRCVERSTSHNGFMHIKTTST